MSGRLGSPAFSRDEDQPLTGMPKLSPRAPGARHPQPLASLALRDLPYHRDEPHRS